jgi:hypothetical protein
MLPPQLELRPDGPGQSGRLPRPSMPRQRAGVRPSVGEIYTPPAAAFATFTTTLVSPSLIRA